MRKTAVLIEAWKQVRNNGLASDSRQTREEIKLFDRDAHRHLRRIQSDLHKERFTFDPQFGLLQPRLGKKPRPIVIATVKNRVVQRAVLDVLQSTEEVREVLAAPTSFGGIRDRGREQALSAAYQAIESGARFYLRSDIRDFFTRIPRERVQTFVANFIPDPRFLQLLRSATQTELRNLEELRTDAEHFPIHEIGVAQGCALSPLLGNLVLREFDKCLNGRDIVCLRYIDDFLLLGPNRHRVLAAFDNARRLLTDLGLEAYELEDTHGKAVSGNIREGFDFLGCHVRPGVIQPSRAARTRFRARVQEIVVSARRSMNAASGGGGGSSSGLVQHLFNLDNVVRGWAHSHSFCNAPPVTADLDRFIDEEIEALFRSYAVRRQAASAVVSRRLLGVQLLQDARGDPIVRSRRKALALNGIQQAPSANVSNPWRRSVTQ